MAKIVIKVSEVIDAEDPSITQAANPIFKVSLSSHIDSISTRPDSLFSHPCLRSATTTLTFPEFKNLQNEVSWLFEEHLVSEPFATTRADHARQLIYEHGLQLKRGLGIIEEDLERNAIDEVVFDIHDGDRTRMLLWEVLESPDLWDRQLLICTRRSVSQNLTPRPVKRQSTNPPVQSKLNILMLVARKPVDKIDHQLTSRLLVDMLETKPSLKEQIELKICRPGSKDALVHALRQKDYDILHLDLHGNIDDQGPCLLFQSSNLNPPDWVRASEVAAIISQNRIGLVVMNACKSAQHSGDKMQNSLAASLVQSGVSCVVGMSYEISDQAVRVFHRTFYEALLDGGKDVALAVSIARSALRHHDSRESAIFGSEVFIHDYIIPVVYYADEQQPLRSLPSSSPQHTDAQDQIACIQTETLATNTGRLCVGRNAEAFDIENKLLRSGVTLVEGPFGIGKRRLMDDLASWFQKSGLVRATYKLDCSEGTLLEEHCLELCLQQYSSDVPPSAVTEPGASNPDPNSMMDLIDRQSSILLIFDINDRPPWVKTLVEKFASVGGGEDIPARFLLISSTTSLAWLKDGLTQPRAWNATCRLGPIDRASAMHLLKAHFNTPLTPVLSINPPLPTLETEDFSPALWYYFQLLALLGYNPLAIELASGLLATTGAGELLWQLQTDKVTLDWDGNAKLRRLASNWTRLISRWGTLMLALLPCQQSISSSLLTALFTSISQDPPRTVSTFVESLVVAGAVSMVGRKGRYDSFQLLNLHPLLCQYIRHQQWDETHLRKIWLNMATFYHNESLKWISTGLYSSDVVDECRREWQNLMAVLRYLVLADLDINSPESSLFDLPWLVCSFVALNATMSRLEKDIFLSLTVSALQELSLDFQVTESYPWQLIFEAGAKKSALIIPEQQIVRICLTCLNLVQSFYDTSEVTARDYNHLLLVMLRTLDFSSFDHDLSKFLKTVLCFCMLISDELDVEDGTADFGNKTHQYIESEGLETSFTAFAKTWNQTHLYRSLGYHSNLNKTRETIELTALSNRLPQKEIQTQLESLDDLKYAFEAINGDTVALKTGVKTLEERLQSAAAKNDTRRQLDLYEKLVELYTKRNDWRAVLFVLDKIDELSEDMARFPGVRSDEISFLRQQRWMLARRAKCLKRLGSVAGSKAVVKQLREVIDRRERLWSKADRNKEQQRNMTAAIESDLARSHDRDGSTRELSIGDHAFMLQRYYTDDGPAPVGDTRITKHVDSDQNNISPTEAPVDTSLSNEMIESWSNDLLGSQTPRPDQQQAGEIQTARSRLASLQLDDSTPAATPPSAQDAPDLDFHSAVDQSDTSDAEVQQYADEYDYANKDDDADDLYFVLNPWMIQPCRLLRQLTLGPGGGREVQTYRDFQMPPGHVGGYFLTEGKRFIAEHYLRLLGVKPEVS